MQKEVDLGTKFAAAYGPVVYDQLGPDRLEPHKHACPIEGCGLSAEEHHYLTEGTLALQREVSELRRRLAAGGDE